MDSNERNLPPLPGEPLLLAAVIILLILSSPARSFAISDIVVGSLIDDGITSLSRGGLKELPQAPQSLDFSSPLFMDTAGKFRVDTSYERQRTVRIFNGRWAGTHAYSSRLETSVAAPYSFFDDRIKGSFGIGYGDRSVDVRAESSKEGLNIRSKENIEGYKGGLYLEALQRVRVGVAAISNNVRDGLEVPVEAEVKALPFLKLGYKHSYLDLDTAFDVSFSGHNANVPLVNMEEIHELYTVLDYSDIIYLKYANELKKTGNRRVEGKLNIPASIYLVGNYAQREFAGISENFSFDGDDGGTFSGRFRKSQYRVGIGAAVTKKWSVEANYRHGDFFSDGGGVASTTTILGFWPSLLVGNYNYLYTASLKSSQYHLGTRYEGDRFSFGMGMQYLDLRPQGNVDYWRNVLFGLGRTGAGNVQLTVDRVEMLFISFGLGYRWQNVGINYAFGQFIPIATHDSDGADGGSSGGSGRGRGGGGGRDFFSSLADKINYNPGGNIQRVTLTLNF